MPIPLIEATGMPDYAAIEKRLIQLHEQVDGDFEKLQPLVTEEFGWSRGQVYWATEFLYRPENYN